MMISPEGYYEASLKGKSQQEVLKEIRSLKREINRLKRYIEEHSLEQEDIFPSRLTRLKCNIEYLERAIQAYREAGGEYILTKAERRRQDFDVALDSIERLVLSIGGYFGGYETRTYTVTDNNVLLNVDHTLEMKPSDLPLCCPFTKAEFITGLKKIHIGEWKRNYIDPYILDGTQWELEIYFGGDRKPLKISGSNAYPYNFSDLTALLGIDEEEAEDEQD